MIDEPLLLYRQHSAQQLGGLRTTFLQKVRIAKSQGRDSFTRTASEYEAALERVRVHADRVLDPRWITALERKVEHFRAKARMREGKIARLRLVISELCRLHYDRYSRGWKSFAQDLFL